jgi:hypothetical protein
MLSDGAIIILLARENLLECVLKLSSFQIMFSLQTCRLGLGVSSGHHPRLNRPNCSTGPICPIGPTLLFPFLII